MASEAAQEDLTEFFEMWGFFVTVDTQIDQYGSYQYTVTKEMIENAKKAMAKYPKKAKPFYYLEDRKKGDIGLDTTPPCWASGLVLISKKGDIGLDTTPPDVGHYTQFQRIRPITKDIKGNINGREVSITNGDEAVAFELREKDANGKLLYFSTFIKFEVPLTVSLTYAKLYAVQADGKRILLEE